MVRYFRFASLALLQAVAWPAAALEPLDLPAPLAPPPPRVSPGESALGLAAAVRAQALGFSSTAAALYRSMLEAPGADPSRLNLALATALLDDGDVAGAARALDAAGPPHGAAWHLRQGMIAAYNRRLEAAASELASIKPGELTAVDHGWYFFLEGLAADLANDGARAVGFYQQAVASASAVSSLQRARFLLAEEQARLRVGSSNEVRLANDRLNMETFRGQTLGYSFAREYAIALNASNRKPQAIEVLQEQLKDIDGLPPRLQERVRAEADHFRLLLGLIAGADEGAGRRQLFQLLASGGDADRQRVALQLLFRSSASGAARAEFRQRLDELAAAPRAHPVLDNILLCRAQLALGDREYAQAEDAAHALLDKFPGSTPALKANAYAVLSGSAWERGSYRTAADYAFRARAEVPAGVMIHAEFGVLVAEAWFRAGDFRSAADAYAAALRDPPGSIAPGTLMFQRVQSEIHAGAQAGRPGALKPAEAVLDELARDPRFDVVNRWKAEWNLARALEVAGETPEAYARVNRLLALPRPAALPNDLRANMAWLQARLSFDSARPDETLRLIESLNGSLAGLDPKLRADIAGTGALLRAEACFALRRDPEALDVLRRLRADYPGTDAAVYSYIVEASHYAAQDKVADAQRLLIDLADKFPQSQYAPYALYQAALQAERLGQVDNLNNAYKLLEKVANDPRYREGDLAFYARLRQGDLLEKLNQYPQAQDIYKSLVDDPHYSQNPDMVQNVILARLALAKCHSAQAANDPSHAKQAADLFEDLVERIDAPADVRVEAGYNLGGLLKRGGAPEKAQEIWWRDVVDPFLVRPGGDQALGAKGRHWLELTLLQAGDLYEQEGRLEEAKRAWSLVAQKGLPGADLARDRLKRFNLPAAPP